MKDMSELIFHMDCLAPEVRTAQAMAEFRNQAMHHQRRIQKYKDWADPVKRAVMKEKAEEVKKISWQEFETKFAENAAQFDHDTKVPYTVKE